MSNRYIYHYNAVTKGGAASMSGVAQLNFRIKSQEDIEVLKGLINCNGFIVHAITSLSYLGRESDKMTRHQRRKYTTGAKIFLAVYVLALVAAIAGVLHYV